MLVFIVIASRHYAGSEIPLEHIVGVAATEDAAAVLAERHNSRRDQHGEYDYEFETWLVAE